MLRAQAGFTLGWVSQHETAFFLVFLKFEIPPLPPLTWRGAHIA